MLAWTLTTIVMIAAPQAPIGRPHPAEPIVAHSANVLVSDIQRRGSLHFAVERGTVAYYLHKGEPRGFELKLLQGFAKELGVKLIPLVTETAADAARLVADRTADVAIVPWPGFRQDGIQPLPPYLRKRGERTKVYPSTGAPVFRDDAPGLRRRFEAYLQGLPDKSLALLRARYFRRGKKVAPARYPKISPYDALIAKHAGTAGIDWRLVASLIYEESRFDPLAVSHKGAAGLMQLMPVVVTEVGIDDPHNPESSILGGVRHLRNVARYFPNAEGEDRVALTLAGYLMGPAHVLDAQRLARELGYDPDVWADGVAEVLPLLEKREHYEKARYGFAPGRHAVSYVRRIFERFRHYEAQVGDEPGRADTADHTPSSS